MRLLKASVRDQIAARVMPSTGAALVWLDDTTYLSGTVEDVELYIVELLRQYHVALLDMERAGQGVLPCDPLRVPEVGHG